MDGLDKLLKNLDRIATPEVINDALLAQGFAVQGAARKSMAEQSGGKAYEGRGGTHIASKPGDAPNVDTGALIRSIAVENPVPMQVFVGTSIEYGLWLEVGTGTIAARPWLIPANEAERKNLPKRIAEALRREIQRLNP